jgi:hypothetical protein
LIVEHLTRVTQTADMDPGAFEVFGPARRTTRQLIGFVLLALACNATHQIEDVEFGRGMTQQMGDISESLTVL